MEYGYDNLGDFLSSLSSMNIEQLREFENALKVAVEVKEDEITSLQRSLRQERALHLAVLRYYHNRLLGL